MIQQLLFLVVLGVSAFFITKRVRRIRANIQLGKPLEVVGDKSTRLKNVLLLAFGQKKMFKKPVPAIFHFIIYAGFLIINLEVLEFIIDGVTGHHRIFAPFLGSFYTILMNVFEFLAAGVLLACIVFLIRRNVLKIERFHSPELTRWPILDANLILSIEIVLMLAILTMNACDQLIQTADSHYPATGRIWISSFLIPLFSGIETSTLIIIERMAWWFHILGILAFAVYVTYSKHLHIFFAFINTYFARLEAPGKLSNMPVVTREVKIMLGLSQDSATTPPEPGRFGVKDVNDLSQSALIAAYSCTECGRCTAECPANQTGKLLSPRKIMMDVRDRMEEVGNSLEKKGPGLADGKTLLDTYITREEINACTSCNACVEACPVMINPLDIIIEMRRYVTMEESAAPASWNAAFQNIETNFAPWKFASSDRFKWAQSQND